MGNQNGAIRMGQSEWQNGAPFRPTFAFFYHREVWVNLPAGSEMKNLSNASRKRLVAC